MGYKGLLIVFVCVYVCLADIVDENAIEERAKLGLFGNPRGGKRSSSSSSSSSSESDSGSRWNSNHGSGSDDSHGSDESNGHWHGSDSHHDSDSKEHHRHKKNYANLLTGLYDQYCSLPADSLSMTELGDNLYYFYTDTCNPKTWPQARDWCRDHGLVIASIEDENQNALITEKIAEILEGKPCVDQFFWFGLNDKATEGEYKFNRLGATVVNFFWNKNEPEEDDADISDCGQIIYYGGGWGWNDAPCDCKGLFICQPTFTCESIENALKGHPPPPPPHSGSDSGSGSGSGSGSDSDSDGHSWSKGR